MEPIRCPLCAVLLPRGTLEDCCALCVMEDEVSETAGRVLGDCELFEEIGRGGMGLVWRGRQRGLDRPVAVKPLPGWDLAGTEARTLSATLADKPVPARQAARWLRDAAFAVQHAHDHGVLHRDLKPSDVLIEPGRDRRHPRVKDFGLAKMTEAEAGVTLSGNAAGSPSFMSPEQARGNANPGLLDFDGDGLSNLLEQFHGLNLFSADVQTWNFLPRRAEDAEERQQPLLAS